MALLHRFLRLNDVGQTGIFTFIVTQSVTRDVHRDIITKEFRYLNYLPTNTFHHLKALTIVLKFSSI